MLSIIKIRVGKWLTLISKCGALICLSSKEICFLVKNISENIVGFKIIFKIFQNFPQNQFTLLHQSTYISINLNDLFTMASTIKVIMAKNDNRMMQHILFTLAFVRCQAKSFLPSSPTSLCATSIEKHLKKPESDIFVIFLGANIFNVESSLLQGI